MKQKYLVLIIILILLLLSLAYFWYQKNLTARKVAGVSEQYQNIRGIILPHHSVAAGLIDKALTDIGKKQQFSTIVIFGPNHFVPEKAPLITADFLNNANIRQETVNNFASSFPNFVIKDNKTVQEEHSITILLPYLKNYFPDAQIVPLIISPLIKMDEIEKISQNFKGEDVLYIASIDFSHNSTDVEGLDKNNETIKIMTDFNYPRLLELKDDHLDSPHSAILLLKIMTKYGTSKWETLENTHSSILTGDSRLKGTSYVIGIFN